MRNFLRINNRIHLVACISEKVNLLKDWIWLRKIKKMANCFLHQEEKFIHDNAGRYTIEKWFNNRRTTHDSFEGDRMEKKNSSYSVLLWVCHKVMLNVYANFFHP